MKHLLVGNGINIQFDNKSYATKEIVLRILQNCDRTDFPAHIIINEPYLMKNYIGRQIGRASCRERVSINV